MGAKGWWDVRRGGDESRGVWPSILLWDALPVAVWNGIAPVQPGILPEKCISHMSEVCGLTIAIIYPFPEYCWSIPMFYLYGEIAWCTTVSSLLQAVLFQLYSGEFAYYGLLLQMFELRKYCDLTNTFCLLASFCGVLRIPFSCCVLSSFPFKISYNTEEKLGRLCFAFSSANYRDCLEELLLRNRYPMTLSSTYFESQWRLYGRQSWDRNQTMTASVNMERPVGWSRTRSTWMHLLWWHY